MLSTVTAAAAETEPRIALVIGNGDYAAGRLANAVLDARSMADTLRDLGFKVLAHENTGYREMRRALAESARSCAPTVSASSTTRATACR